MILLQSKGDHRAFTVLYDRYGKRLNAFFFRMLWQDDELAQDHVQELFTKIIQRPELYDSQYDFEPWIFQVAANMCKNAYRKKSFQEAYEHTVEMEVSRPTVEEELDNIVLTNQIHSILDAMEEDRRMIFLMRYQQDLSIADIAKVLDLPHGTIKSKLHYTRERIRKSLNY